MHEVQAPKLKPEGPVGATRFDRLLWRVAPGWAARREAARTRCKISRFQRDTIDFFGQEFRTGGYRGANKVDGQAKWITGAGDADADTIEDLETLRGRSRDLVRNDPHASGLLDTWVGNVVGDGLVPQSRIDRKAVGLSDVQASEFQRQAERIWTNAGKYLDISGLLEVGELQALILYGLFESGETFTLRRAHPRPSPAGLSLALQVVEADRVTSPPNLLADANVRDGIVLDQDGRHTSYWVRKTHPGAAAASWQPDDFVQVPAVDAASGWPNVWHTYRIRRPGQSHGVPFLAPALTTFRDLQQYIRAELIGAKVAACISLWITVNDPLGEAQAATKKTIAENLKTSQDQPVELVQPGTIQRLLPGEKIEGFSPNRPNTAFPQFVNRILRSIGVSISHPYELIAQDFSDTNYSSGRMALTEVRRVYEVYRRWFVRRILQKLYELVLEEAVLRGLLWAPAWSQLREEYTRAIWMGPGWQYVDPSKEVAATGDALDRNMTTLAEELASQGKDWEQVFAQRAIEIQREKDLGIRVEKPAQPDAGAPDDEEEPDDGESEAEDEVPE